MTDAARETTLDEVEDRMEERARQVTLYNYQRQSVYHMDPACTRHTPFTPTNMDSDVLQLVDAELSFLLGDNWCHQQSPNNLWNQFFFDRMHYTVGEWITARDSNWLDGPPWLKVSLATWAGRNGENPYAFLLEDDEVQILMAEPPQQLVRPVAR